MLKKDQVKVGGYYTAKVSNRSTVLKVTEVLSRKGFASVRGGTRWRCINLITGREIVIKSAQRFREEVPVCDKCGKPFTRFRGDRKDTCLTCLEGKPRSSIPALNDDSTLDERTGRPFDRNRPRPTIARSAGTPASSPATQPVRPTAGPAEGPSRGGSGQSGNAASDRPVARTEVTRKDGEYQVKAYASDGTRLPAADYFTSDRADALKTAELMVKIDPDGRRIVHGCYFKDYGDHRPFVSGLPIPTDEDGVCRNIRFVDCDFHPGCRIRTENVVYERCDRTADHGFKYDDPQPAREAPPVRDSDRDERDPMVKNPTYRNDDGRPLPVDD